MVRNFRKQQTCVARALSRALTTWNTQNYDARTGSSPTNVAHEKSNTELPRFGRIRSRRALQRTPKKKDGGSAGEQSVSRSEQRNYTLASPIHWRGLADGIQREQEPLAAAGRRRYEPQARRPSTVRRLVADFLEREEEGIPHGRREQMGEGRDVGTTSLATAAAQHRSPQ
jgi:hypothetical protein